MKVIFSILLSISINIVAIAQVGVGQWRDHLPYANAEHLTLGNDKVYCSTAQSLFTYTFADGYLEKINTITGLSDIEISALAFNKESETLIIGYASGNIDVIKDFQITNYTDIKDKQIEGSKSINAIYFIGNIAYLSCGFGIVLFDSSNGNIYDTYLIGENGAYLNIHELVYSQEQNQLFAATEKGIYRADIDNPNLINYQNWSHDTLVPHYDGEFESIVTFNGNVYTIWASGIWHGDKIYRYDGNSWTQLSSSMYDANRLVASENYLFVARNNSLNVLDLNDNMVQSISNYEFGDAEPSDVAFDGDKIWIADHTNGLVFTSDYTSFESAFPNGPLYNGVAKMTSVDDKLWVTRGGKMVTNANLYQSATAYSFVNENWQSFNYKTIPELTKKFDFYAVAIHPANPDRVFVASWGNGIFEFLNNEYVRTHTDSSTDGVLQNIPGYSENAYTRVADMEFDSDYNMWILQSQVPRPIVVRLNDGTWKNFNYPEISNNNRTSEILITSSGDKWVLIPDNDASMSIFVFNENGTFDNISDDNKAFFNPTDDEGNLISKNVYSIAEDMDGTILLGTNEGVIAYYNPQNVFNNQSFYAQRIIVEFEEDNAQYLLGKESVTAIAIDGANRKWFGTTNGVFLLSANLDKQIYAFNTDNSPLISDHILSIAINDGTGEVFFGTEKGIISFRSDAKKPEEFINDVYVFPNPVTHQYEGLITISGLVSETNVKITDVAGNLVWETTSNGGEAVWNGRNFNNEKPQTGVYLVFCTNDDGTKTAITKFLIVN